MAEVPLVKLPSDDCHCTELMIKHITLSHKHIYRMATHSEGDCWMEKWLQGRRMSCHVSIRQIPQLCYSILIICQIPERVQVDCNIWTHWGRFTHTFINKLISIGSDNGLSPGQCQAISWNITGILLIVHLATNFSKIFSEIRIFSFQKIHLKMWSAKWPPFCLGLKLFSHVAFRYWIAITMGEGVSLTFRELSKIISRKYTMP